MTAKWQAGHTYVPGSLVLPSAGNAPTHFEVTNGYFEADSSGTGWDFSGGVVFSATGGYGSPHCCIKPGPWTGAQTGEALDQAHLTAAPGTKLRATCMIQQGASDVDHTRGWVVVRFYDASDNQIGNPATGNVVNDGRGGAWQASTVEATFPANASYARAGIALYQNSSDAIWGDNLVVSSLKPPIPDGLVYKATQAKPGKSGSSEPAWPGVTGVEVTDNEVTWEGVIATSITWTASPIMETGDTEPAWPTDVGGVVRDGSVNWTAVSRRITDANCPNSKVVAIMASKVFAADGDIVRFSATVNPLDWTSEQNAGYLPTGLQQANANDMAVLAPYRSNLTTFNASSFQNWQVDPDPSAMAILDQLEGVGSTHQHAAQPVGNELFYLSQLGVRTVSIAGGSDNLKAGDVGMPIDPLIQAAALVDTTALGPRAMYYPGAGQYWLAFGTPAPAPPPVALPLQDFETDTAPFTGAWTRSTATPIGGSYSLRSPDINNSSSTQASLVIAAGIEGATRKLAFDWVVSSESGYDWLSVTINGTQILHKSGAINGHYEDAIPAGVVTVVFTYAKDSGVSNGTDDAAIDNVRVYYDPPVTTPSPHTPWIYVCTLNAGKPKWSRYVFPWAVDAFAQLGNDLYIRHGDTISMLDESATDDDGTPFTGTVQWPWLDMGQAGVTKMMEGFDLVASGTPSVSVGYDQTDATAFTAPYACGPDTLTGSKIPLPLMAPTFSPKLTFAGGEQWSVQALTLYVNNQRGQP